MKPRAGRSKSIGCMGGCIAIHAFVLLFVWGLMAYNNRLPTVFIPPPLPRPAQNAFDAFALAGKLAQGHVNKSPLSASRVPKDQAEVKKFADACAKEAKPLLPRVRSALNSICLAPQVRTMNQFHPEYAQIRELERTLIGVSISRELHGRYFEAADIALDGLELGVMLPKGGATLSTLVSIACQAIAERQLVPQIEHLSISELDQVGKRLDLIALKRPRLEEIVREEGFTSTSQLIEMLQILSQKNYVEQLKFLDQLTSGGFGSPRGFQQKLELIRYLMTNKQQVVDEVLKYYQAWEKIAALPYNAHANVTPPKGLGRIFTFTVQSLIKKWETKVAFESIIRVEVALRRYQLRNRAFPDNLTQLTPKYLGSLPDDPFGGSRGVKLIYRSSKDRKSFLLYSRGPDTIDNNGRPGNLTLDYAGGDIVAGQLYPVLYWRK